MSRLTQISILINILGLCLACIITYKQGGISNLVHKLKSQHVIAKMDHRISQFSNSDVNNNCIVFLGDSITEYGEWAELFPNYNILNRGVAGDGIDGVINRLEEVARHSPKIIFLMIGINDLSFHEADVVKVKYKNILQTIQQIMPKTELVVQNILPINNNIYNTGIDNKSIDNVNEAIQASCFQMKISYLDINKGFKDEENNLKTTFTSDGIHINGIAYNKWKKELNHWFPIE